MASWSASSRRYRMPSLRWRGRRPDPLRRPGGRSYSTNNGVGRSTPRVTADVDDGDNGGDDDVDRSAPPPRRRRLDPCHHCPEIIADSSSLLATVMGSSNYGSRSQNLNVESNCILIFNDDSSMAAGGGGGCGSSVKESVAAKWNELCRPSVFSMYRAVQKNCSQLS